MTKAPAVSAEEMRRIDERAVKEFHIPVLKLMENAGKSVANACLKTIRANKIKNPKVLLLCGGGNNGGDGFVAARRLYLKKIPVSILLFKPKESLKGPVLINFRKLIRLKIPHHVEPTLRLIMAEIKGSHLIVDAIFGTGLKRNISGVIKKSIRAVNASEKPVIAVDIPSGMDADTAEVHGVSVKADLTITMGALKLGFLKKKSRRYTGKIEVADIGFPKSLFSKPIF